MQMLQYSYRGLDLLVRLNWDRLLFTGALMMSLILGAWLATM